MKKCLFVGLIIVCSFGQMYCQSVDAESYYTPENVLRFADYLKEQKEFLAAATEYKRYLLLNPEANDSLRLLIGKCYLMTDRNDLAVKYFRSSQSALINQQNESEVLLLQSYAHFMEKNYDTCNQLLQNRLRDFVSKEQKQQREFLLAASSIVSKQEYETFLHAGKDTTLLMLSLQTLVTEQRKNSKDKSPLVAAGLSALIPGSGKIYGGQTIDGLFSFVSIALTGWQAYEGFSKDGSSSVKGWLVGSLAATFYIGNIYGSAVNIQLQNRTREKMFEDDVRALVKASFHF